MSGGLRRGGRLQRSALPSLLAAALIGVAAAAHRAGEAPAAETHVVEVRGFEYGPATLEIARGDTVVWVNRDPVPHTATDVEGGWDTGEISADGRGARVFSAAGEMSYRCTLHPGMRGTVVVR